MIDFPIYPTLEQVQSAADKAAHRDAAAIKQINEWFYNVPTATTPEQSKVYEALLNAWRMVKLERFEDNP